MAGLADDGKDSVLPSPVKGRVSAIVRAPDLRGSRDAQAVWIKPNDDTSSLVFPPLDPGSAPVAKLMDRIREAGVVTAAQKPRPLLETIGAGADVVTHTESLDR